MEKNYKSLIKRKKGCLWMCDSLEKVAKFPEKVACPLLFHVDHAMQNLNFCLIRHCTMCILSSTMALWSKAEIQKYTF